MYHQFCLHLKNTRIHHDIDLEWYRKKKKKKKNKKKKKKNIKKKKKKENYTDSSKKKQEVDKKEDKKEIKKKKFLSEKNKNNGVKLISWKVKSSEWYNFNHFYDSHWYLKWYSSHIFIEDLRYEYLFLSLWESARKKKTLSLSCQNEDKNIFCH